MLDSLPLILDIFVILANYSPIKKFWKIGNAGYSTIIEKIEIFSPVHAFYLVNNNSQQFFIRVTLFHS